MIKVSKNQPKFPFQTEIPCKIYTREGMKSLHTSKESKKYLNTIEFRVACLFTK
jgi:hypothetical protein